MKNFSYKKIFSLNNKVAVVAGGCGILGEKFCEGLAAYGANVAIVDIDYKNAKKLSDKINLIYGIKSIPVLCDLTVKKSVDRMVKKVLLEFGEINILVNNAASKTNNLKNFFKNYENYDLKTWKNIMSVNLDGMFLTSQAICAQMVKQKKGGSVIQISSIYGILAPDQRIYKGSFYLGGKINTPAAYSASKAGVIGLSRYLSTYYANKKIKVNTITPGGIESGQNKKFKQFYSKRVPMNRMGKAHELVGALIFLSSDSSSYITGQNIIVDGGLTTW